MGFGCSYSLLEVDTIEFVHSSPLKKFLRTLLGGGFSVMIYYGAYGFYDWASVG